MEKIIEKLKQMKTNNSSWSEWDLKEIKKLLGIYLVISKNEAAIYELIYGYHGCDSWEDIFRDFNPNHLDDKATGVEVALEQVDELIKSNEKN